MNRSHPSSASFFEAKYLDNEDPWKFAVDAYEQNRYQAILHALAPCRYQAAWEPGCSVGILTQQLASICDRVDACDFSMTAVEIARHRCAGLSSVHINCASLTDDAPISTYDLILLSEIGYYFTRDEWLHQVERVVSQMQPEATLLASHWLGHSPDHMQCGDEVHAILLQHSLLKHEHDERHEQADGGFRLDRWRRV